MSTQRSREHVSKRSIDRQADIDALTLYIRDVETRARLSRDEEQKVAEAIVAHRRDITAKLSALVLDATDALGIDPTVARRLREELSNASSERKLEALGHRLDAIVSAARHANETLRERPRERNADAVRRARRLLAEIATGFGMPPSTLERIAAEISEKRQQIAAAKQLLVEANLRLVVYFARRMKWRGVDAVDLVQEGNIALLRAADAYDPTRGFAFGSFACTAIRRAMSRFGSAASRPVHVPVEVRARRNRVCQAERHLTTRDGVAPSWQEIADYLGVSMAVVVDALDSREEAVSLDSSVDDDTPILSRLADDDAPDVTEAIEVAQADRRVRDSVAALEERDRKILESRFDLAANGAATLAEVGRDLGVTRERARQLEAQALRQLRARGAAGRRRGKRRAHDSPSCRNRSF